MGPFERVIGDKDRKLQLSGFQLPSPIVSTGSRITLWLLSDYAVSGQGFKAVYE
ncbi:hypothetical protein KUCAC02_011659, partial [Chaenocephalus aceratus]